MQREPVWLDKGWQPVPLLFVTTEESWINTLKEFDIPEDIEGGEYPKLSAASTNYLVNQLTGDDLIIVVLNHTKSLLEVIGLMAHEATHVFDYICEAIGEDNPSKEFKAYSIQMITMNLLDAYSQVFHEGKLFS